MKIMAKTILLTRYHVYTTIIVGASILLNSKKVESRDLSPIAAIKEKMRFLVILNQSMSVKPTCSHDSAIFESLAEYF